MGTAPFRPSEARVRNPRLAAAVVIASWAVVLPNSGPPKLSQFARIQLFWAMRRSRVPVFAISRCLLLAERDESSGANVDQRLKTLMKELGEAINNSLSDSDQIAEVVSRIKADGYDVFLVLEATIGFNRSEDTSRQASVAGGQRGVSDFSMTAQDVKFLKSLRISIGEEG